MNERIEHTELIKAVKGVKDALTTLIIAYNADDRLRDKSLCPADFEGDLEKISDTLEEMDSLISREYTTLYVK